MRAYNASLKAPLEDVKDAREMRMERCATPVKDIELYWEQLEVAPVDRGLEEGQSELVIDGKM
ncbi:hypothetical protein HK101_001306, partial [Irineochytrium annulatum]